MAADTPYVAQTRLRFGDGVIQPGEPVPVQAGRNYALMLGLGQIVFAAGAGVPVAGGAPHVGNSKPAEAVRQARAVTAHVADEDLEDLKRKELDELAAREGVEDPDKLPNRDAVIEAIEARRNPVLPDE